MQHSGMLLCFAMHLLCALLASNSNFRDDTGNNFLLSVKGSDKLTDATYILVAFQVPKLFWKRCYYIKLGSK